MLVVDAANISENVRIFDKFEKGNLNRWTCSSKNRKMFKLIDKKYLDLTAQKRKSRKKDEN